MNFLRAFADGPGVILGAAIVYCYIFWLLYVLVMGFYRASLAGNLPRVALLLGAPLIITAIVIDLLANWTVASLWFWQWPARTQLPKLVFIGWRPRIAFKRPDLVTSRLSRYIAGPDCWRKDHADWLCRNLLDIFDPRGSHCK